MRHRTEMFVGFLVVLSVSTAVSIGAQTASRTFEVASVKPAPPGDGGPVRSVLLFLPDGRFRNTNTTLKSLIQTAYSVQDFQVDGATGWMDSDRYDVEGKAEGSSNPSRADVLLMLQSLLAERFKLKLSRETKENTQYALVVAKGGPKIKLAADPAGGARGGANGLLVGKRTMPQLATMLSGIVRRPVIDQTGLQGVYEFTLEWLPEVGQTGPDTNAPPPANPNAPSLFTALQEQMGLRLESIKGQVEVLVIEHAERPSAN